MPLSRSPFSRSCLCSQPATNLSSEQGCSQWLFPWSERIRNVSTWNKERSRLRPDGNVRAESCDHVTGQTAHVVLTEPGVERPLTVKMPKGHKYFSYLWPHQQSQSWALQAPEASFKALGNISITVKTDEYKAVFLLTLQTSTAVAMGYLPHMQRRQGTHFWATLTPLHCFMSYNPSHNRETLIPTSLYETTLCSRTTGLHSDGRLKFRFSV